MRPQYFSQDDQASCFGYYASNCPTLKQEITISASEDDDYDELEMYENVSDYRSTALPLESKPLVFSSATTGAGETNVRAGTSELVENPEMNANRIETVVKRKKFRKVRCSKLANQRNQQNDTKTMLLQVQQATLKHQPISPCGTKTCPVEETRNDIMSTSDSMDYPIGNRMENTMKAIIPQKLHLAFIQPERITSRDDKKEAGVKDSTSLESKRTKFGEADALLTVSSIDKALVSMNQNTTKLESISILPDNEKYIILQDVSCGKQDNQEILERKEKENKTIKSEQFLDKLKFTKLRHNDCDTYQCNVCSKLIKSRNKLKYHNSLHTGENPLIAEKTVGKFRFTKINDNSCDVYQCDVCLKTVRNKRQMRRHHKIHTGQKANKSLQILEKFRFTKIKQNDCNMYQCDVCSKILKDKSKLKDHYTLHTGEKSHKCEECGDTFRLESTLRSHRINKHSSERNYICSICNKSYKHATDLKVHMNIHTNTRFKCDLCGSDFSAIQTLKEHIMCRHLEMRMSRDCPSNPVTVECNELSKCRVCQKTFSNRMNLKLHMQTHEGTQEFNCDLCGALFSRKADRDRHRMRHTGERPFKCDTCDYSCIRLGDLNRHKLKHGDRSGGQARQKCPYCEKTLSRKDEMKGHIAAAHLSIKIRRTSFCCTLCDEYFESKYKLNKHNVEVHKKTIDCEYCGQTFTSVSNRSKHIGRFHSQQTFTCNICQKVFQSKSNLHDHCRLMHQDIKKM